jgi:hypothetical protein
MDELSNPYRRGNDATGAARPRRANARLRHDARASEVGASREKRPAGRTPRRRQNRAPQPFRREAEADGYSIAFIEASEAGNFPTLLAVRLRKILLELDRGRVSRHVARALRVLKSFTIQLPDGSSIQLDPEPFLGEADSGRLDDDLTDVLVALGRATADRSRGALIAVESGPTAQGTGTSERRASASSGSPTRSSCSATRSAST